VSREIGAVLGEYRLIASLGSGAAGEVFQAEHLITHRREAIKFLACGRLVTPEEEQGFLREIELQAALQHPNIAAVHNAFRTSEGLALVMEFVEGEPLSVLLARGRIAPADGIRYVLETLDALGYAHGRGIVHGDVKPANIMVGRGGVKLTDFGLARPVGGPPLTSSGTPAGSPYYMAPEQVTGISPPDHRSDYYSLGIVLYEIAAGRRPFEGESAFEVMVQQRDTVPAPPIQVAPEIGAALNRVILTAIEKEPAHRFQSAMQFRSAVESAVQRPVRRGGSALRRWLLAAMLAGAAGAVALTASLHRPPPPESMPPPVQSVPEVPAPAVPSPAVPAPADPQPSPEPPPEPVRKIPPKSAPVRRPKAELPVIASRPPAAEPLPRAAAVRVEEPPPAVAEAADAPPPPEIASEPGPETPPNPQAKKRNIVWRALGHIIHRKAQ
jgi:serine/threonine-protein kinase